jgi:hypothetical protein
MQRQPKREPPTTIGARRTKSMPKSQANELDESRSSLHLDDLIQEKEACAREPASESSDNSSIDSGLLIGHMQVLQSLEQLTKTKAPAPAFRNPLKDRRLRARLQLLSALEHDRLEEFQAYYNLSQEDIMSIGMHVHLCSELNENIHWDLIFQIMFPGSQFNNEIWDPLKSLVALALEEDDYDV